MIIDESHARMFKDLHGFYKATKTDKVMTICLTATPFEGDNDGLQMSALKEIGYKVYKNSNREEDYNPQINKNVELGTIDKFRSFILAESEKCGVLVYANGNEFECLKLEDNIHEVTEKMDHRLFSTMDAKLGHRYPVYLISNKYGGIGLDFRAVSNQLGITLLILGSFPDYMSRIQCLKRVGRFTDKCTRV
jgi:hypothetical protein